MYALGPVHSSSPPINFVNFPHKRLVNVIGIFGLLLMTMPMYIFLFTFQDYEYRDKTPYLYPCNSSISFEEVNAISREINSTAKEIESISTVLNHHLKSNNKLLTEKNEQYKNKIKQLGEKWLLRRNEYYECYKINTIKAFYYEFGYYIVYYYILITATVTVMLAVLHKIKSYNLTAEQLKAVKEIYNLTIGIWIFHLLISPILVLHLFYPEDISNRLKMQFPIYPRFFDVNYIV